MFAPILDALRREFSGAAAKEHIGGLIRFHRVQASPPMRAAAHWCREVLASLGLDARVIAYPARPDAPFWGVTTFQEWDCRDARLEVSAPEKSARTLCDFRESPLSVVQRSTPLDAEAEVVALDDGTEPAHYEDIEVRGKFVLTSAMASEVYRAAVVERGAIGIISDRMHYFEPTRPPGSLPDARLYQSFWWFGEDPQGTGFVLTPRQGQWLRALITKESKEGRAVRLRGVVDSALYDGEIEVVTATIPGQTDEEILIVAHYCHPYGFANDNASGACTVMELAGAIHRAVASGALPSPRRTLRFLLVPEMTGTFCYLASREADLSRLLAGVNLDMVGENQDLCGSSLIVEQEPLASVGHLSFLLEAVREALIPELKSHGGLGGYATFRYATNPFSGGSDHWILCDPTVGIPSALLIQWPDRYYHTTADTLDKVDPQSLERAGLMAGAYACFLASAGPRECSWLAEELVARCTARLAQEARTVVRQALDANDATDAARITATFTARSDLIAEAMTAALDYLQQFGLDDPAEFAARVVVSAQAQAANAVAAIERVRGPLPEWAPHIPEEAADAERIVPRRTTIGPAWTEPVLQHSDPACRKELNDLKQRHPDLPGPVSDLALFWCDGQRSLAEIARRVELETGAACLPYLLGYFRTLDKLGLIALEERVAAVA